MCVFNGRRVTHAEYIDLMKLRRELKNAMDGKVSHGYDYGQWPIVRPTMDGTDIYIKEAHWEFVPNDLVYAKKDLPAFRLKHNTLNARGETLLTNPMFANAAEFRRCLVLSSHFYEHHHLIYNGKEILTPHHIEVRDTEVFYMAGIWQRWTDKTTGKSGDTFAIVTTEANELLADVHNKKKRMPTILPQPQAYDWLFKPLTYGEIRALATYQFPSELMEGWPVGKDFLTNPEARQKVANGASSSILSLF